MTQHRHIALFAVLLMALAAAGCGNEPPTKPDVLAGIRAEHSNLGLDTDTLANISFADYKKNYGVMSETNGMHLYTLNFDATLRIPAWHTTVPANGEMTFVQSDAGWQPRGVTFEQPINGRLTSMKVTADNDLHALESALKLYRLDNYDFPTEAQGLQALVSKPSRDPVPKNWQEGGYIDETALTDPWGELYHYSRADGTIHLTSYGADGEPDGSGPAADISR